MLSAVFMKAQTIGEIKFYLNNNYFFHFNITTIMKSEFIKQYNSAYNTFIEARGEMRKQCLNILKEVCNRTDSKEINLNSLNNYCRDYGMGLPVIAYDGGNHPEYASNLYSIVYGFRLENNKIVFDLEDDPSYEEDRVTIMELIELCGFIIEYETDGNGYILGVDEYGDSE